MSFPGALGPQTGSYGSSDVSTVSAAWSETRRNVDLICSLIQRRDFFGSRQVSPEDLDYVESRLKSFVEVVYRQNRGHPVIPLDVLDCLALQIIRGRTGLQGVHFFRPKVESTPVQTNSSPKISSLIPNGEIALQILLGEFQGSGQLTSKQKFEVVEALRRQGVCEERKAELAKEIIASQLRS
jgi:hypothetical protein